MKRSVALAAALSILTACNDNRPVHTAEWYVQHPQDLAVEEKYCEQLALSERGAECVNAAQAHLDRALHAPLAVNPWSR